LINHAPRKTAGIEKGTNQRKIFHLMCFLNTTIREAELANVPMVNEKGTIEEGNTQLRIGISIKLAPPPQIALIQKAMSVAPKIKHKIGNIKNIQTNNTHLAI
jgi:hypothetical protein